MEFDPNEIIAVRTDPTYLNCIEQSRVRARGCRARGDLRPKKIVDDHMIEFYGSERAGNCDAYGKWFSNCVCAKITVDHEVNLSSEHYFQRQKFIIDESDQYVLEWCHERKLNIHDQIKANNAVRDHMATLSPVAVAKFGQSIRSAPIRSDWDNIRDKVMWDALVAKFTQNDEFAKALISTGERVLIERAPTDSYWAINNSGIGDNTLGAMLMVVRSMLE
jgi:ribA/ribD-fused uncharacterized protein